MIERSRCGAALIAIARARPGQLNYASTGSGSASHLGMELLKKATETDILHVPYKGAAPGLTEPVTAAGTVHGAGRSNRARRIPA